MTEEKLEKIKAYMFTCETCKHEWLSKTWVYQCPECGGVYKIFEKLR